MGLFSFLGDVVNAIFELNGNGKTEFSVECKSFELFEKGTTWKGTARVHGAGSHLETIKVNVSTTLFLPDHSDGDVNKGANRESLRKDLREWAGQEFSLSKSISKDMVVLNEGENCLSIEGFVKKVDSKWKIVNDAGEGTHYGAYKLYFTRKNGESIGHEELHYLFKEDGIGRIINVDVD